MISRETIDKVRDLVDIATIVGEQVQLQSRGGNLLGLCPFHSEKTPSFSVNPRENFFHCFGCGVSGDAIRFVMQTKGLSFPDAVEYIAGVLGIEVKRDGIIREKSDIKDKQKLYVLNMRAFRFFKEKLGVAPEQVKQYVLQRGISEDSIKQFGIGYAPGSWRELKDFLLADGTTKEADLFTAGLVKRSSKGDSYDSFRNRLIFPVSMDGKHILGFGGRLIPGMDDSGEAPKYLNSMETPVYQKSKILYGFPQAVRQIKEAHLAYLVEGYLDVTSLAAVGVGNVVATCGTAITAQHIAKLKYLCSKVCVLFDGDNAGQNAAAKSFETFLNSGVDGYAVFLPDGEDPDTIAQKYGANTKDYLAKLPQHHLFEMYIKFLLSSASVESASQLGTAQKGQLCKKVSEILQKVDNLYERDLLTSKAATILRVDRDIFGLGPSEAKHQSKPEERFQSKESEEVDGMQISVTDLPKYDRQLLIVVMAGKDKIAGEVLADSDICASLHSETLRFIEEIDAIFGTPDLSEEEQKELIKLVLTRRGKTWFEHWKLSYKMLADPTVRLEREFNECKQAFRNLSLEKSLSKALTALKEANNETEQVAISHRIVELKRELQGATRGNSAINSDS